MEKSNLIKVNLLGKVISPKEEIALTMGMFFFCLIPMVALFVFSLTSLNHQKEALLVQRDKMSIELSKYKKEAKVVKEKKDKIAAIEERVGAVMLVKSKKKEAVKILDVISSSISDILWLNMLSRDGQKLKIKGTGIDYKTISSFMDNLKESDMFEDVELTNTSRKVDNDVSLSDFEINITLAS